MAVVVCSIDNWDADNTLMVSNSGTIFYRGDSHKKVTIQVRLDKGICLIGPRRGVLKSSENQTEIPGGNRGMNGERDVSYSLNKGLKAELHYLLSSDACLEPPR